MSGVLRSVMVTVPERHAVRGETLSQLAEAGIRPEVSEQASRERSNRTHTEHCIAAIGGRGPVLLLEDDLLVNPEALRVAVPCALAAAEPEGTACWLWLPGMRHYPAALRRPPRTPTVFRMIAARQVHGSLALVISARAAAELTSAPDENVGFDVALRDHLIARGRPLLGVTPNPVQHRAGRSTIPRHRPVVSATFTPAAPEPTEVMASA